jgi:hypothetical protein
LVEFVELVESVELVELVESESVESGRAGRGRVEAGLAGQPRRPLNVRLSELGSQLRMALHSVNRFMSRTISALVVLPLTFPALAGCKRSSSADEARPAPSVSAVAAASVSRPAPPAPPQRLHLPDGPVLEILPGEGLGPIRFGATVETIERHMQARCDVASAELCRYFARAVEFRLTDGVATGIKVHRRDRSAGKDARGEPAVYGIFHGAIRPDLQLGMIPDAMQEVLGPPQKVELVKTKTSHGEAERHHYPGMALTYDRLDNGKLALGEVELLNDRDAGAAWRKRTEPQGSGAASAAPQRLRRRVH